MRKTLWLLVALLLIALPLLAACAAPAEEAPATETPKAEKPVEPATEEKPAASGPPAIPHDLEGRDNCLMCHETGVGDAPQYPADHAGRTSDMCQACHQPA